MIRVTEHCFSSCLTDGCYGRDVILGLGELDTCHPKKHQFQIPDLLVSLVADGCSLLPG